MSCLLTFRLRHNYRIAETGNIPVRLGWRIITELLKEDQNSVCLLTFWLRHYYRIECWHILHLNLCLSNCIISYSESFQIMSDSHMWSMAMYMSSLTGRLDRPASPWRRGTWQGYLQWSLQGRTRSWRSSVLPSLQMYVLQAQGWLHDRGSEGICC